MDKYLTLFEYQCKVCHHIYIDIVDEAICPVCEAENTPKKAAVYVKYSEETFVEVGGD